MLKTDKTRLYILDKIIKEREEVITVKFRIEVTLVRRDGVMSKKGHAG